MKKIIFALFALLIIISCTNAQKKSDSWKLGEDISIEEIYKRANDQYNKDQFDEAIITYQNCINRNYKIDTCYYKQGVSYILSAQPKIGIEKLESAVKANPKYFKALYNIAATCYDNFEYQKSIEYYQKALKINPSDDTAYYGIAASQFVLKNYAEAKTNCITSLKINPSNVDAKKLLEKLKYVTK